MKKTTCRKIDIGVIRALQGLCKKRVETESPNGKDIKIRVLGVVFRLHGLGSRALDPQP